MASKKSFIDQIEEILRPIDELGADAQLEAIKICDKYSKELKNEAKSKRPDKIRSPYYVNRFTTIPYSKESIGIYGCKVWNRKYPLSHLLEHGHEVRNQYGGPYRIRKGNVSYRNSFQKTIDYNIWNPIELKMIEEFTEAVDLLINKACGSK